MALKENNLFNSLEEFQQISTGKNLLIVDINSIKLTDINFIKKYLELIEAKIEGLLVIEKI